MARDDPLAEAQARVDRATQHITELAHVLDGVTEGCLGELQINEDPMTGELLEVVEPIEFRNAPPPLASMLVGEIVYNLRAALDYAVFALARANTGTDVPGTQFPIDADPATFDARSGGRAGRAFLRGVHADHVDVIRHLQPFAGCQWTALLRDLSNPDKHRRLTVLVTESEIDPYFKVIDPSVPSVPSDPPVVLRLTVGGDVRIKIAFDGDEVYEVVTTLRQLQAAVGDAVALFGEALQTQP